MFFLDRTITTIFLGIDSAFELLPLSNSSYTVGSTGRNKHHPWIITKVSMQQMHTYMNDSQQATVWAACVVRLVSTADSRTKRLRLLLTISNSCHCMSLSSRGWCLQAFQTNKHHPQIVVAQKWAAKKRSRCGIWLKRFGILTLRILQHNAQHTHTHTYTHTLNTHTHTHTHTH